MTESAGHATRSEPQTSRLAGADDIVDRLSDGVAVLTPLRGHDGRVVDLRLEHLNPAGCRLLGIASLPEVQGASMCAVVPGLELAQVLAVYDRCRSTGAHLRRELYDQRGPERRWVHVDASVDEAGRLIVLFRDVTEVRGALEEAEHERARAAQLVQALPEAYVALDDAWHIVSANPAFEALVGLAASRLVGRSLWHVAPELVGTEVEQAARLAAAQRVAVDAEARWRGHALSVRAHPTVDGTALVARPAATAEGFDARRLATLASLTGAIGHDFNNLLTVVHGHAQLLRHSAAEERTISSLDAIASAAERASELTRHLLAVTRRHDPKPAPQDLGRLVRDAEPLLRRVAAGVGLELTTAEVPAVVDAPEVLRLLLDLVADAARVMGDGTEISVAVTAEHDEAVITVTAHGEAAGPRDTEGLAVLARLAGGLLTIDEHQRVARLSFPLDGHLETGPSPLTVLLVEDHDQVRDLAAAALSGAGFRVLAAASADEALRRAAEEPGPIDLLLSDVVMPGRGGVDLAADLAQMRPGVPTLLISGYAESTVLPGGPSGHVEFLGKPFTPAQLVSRARRLVEQHPVEHRERG